MIDETMTCQTNVVQVWRGCGTKTKEKDKDRKRVGREKIAGKE